MLPLAGEITTVESDRYSWMDQLLCGEGEDFSQAAAEALEFLGYEVQLIDNQLAPGQRKREDLHVIDKAASYFALGETKSTRRGASEGFLTDVQNHQGRYSRENQCPIPMAILVVNHSHDLNPNQRGPRFYIDPAILDRCREQGITAIDSVFLHELCQKTLARALSQEQAREIIQSGPGLLPYTPKLPQ